MRAFTLVETLTAMLIITTVILGPLTVAINASSYAKQTKDVMIATYLSQEALELIHHLQDSIYLKCTSDTVESTCASIDSDGDGVYNNPDESAWILLDTYLKGTNSCFSSSGCTFDFIGMTTDENSAPVKYEPTKGECDSLYLTSGYLYICSGAHGPLSGGTLTSFNRVVKVESIDTIPVNSKDYIFKNDLRVTVTTSFIRSNGYTRSIKLVDFLHAHK